MPIIGPHPFDAHNRETPDEANHLCLVELPVEEDADETGKVSGGDGSGGALGAVDRADRTSLHQQGPTRALADAASERAADLLHAAVVCNVRSGDGRCALRD